MRLVTLTLLVCACACKSSPDPPATPPTTSPTSPPDTAAPPVAAFVKGAGDVEFTTLQTLREADGMLVQRHRWRHGRITGVGWVVSFPRTAGVEVSPSPDVVPFVDLLPDDEGPWAAINGGFYERIPNGNGHRAMGLVVAAGNEEQALTRRGGSGVFYGDSDGPHIVHRKAFNAAPTYALQSIDRIVDAGKSVVKKRPNQPLAMRSAVALSKDRLWLVAIAADADITPIPAGAQLSRSGQGVPLGAFAEYVIDVTGASEALNLDGGISTQLAVRDKEFVLEVRGVAGTINAVVVRPAPAR